MLKSIAGNKLIMRIDVSADQSNSDLDALRKSLCKSVEKNLNADGVERLVRWIDGQRDTFAGSGFCDSAIRLINDGTPAKAVVEISEELCLFALSIDRFDDSPGQKKKIEKIRKKIAGRIKPLHAAKTMIQEAWKISEANYCYPTLPGNPERITEEELKIVNIVIEKAIRWSESLLISEGLFDATLRLPEKGTGKPGRQKLSPNLSWLMFDLRDLYNCVGFNRAKSSRLIAAWINHFAGLGHSWLTEYDDEGRRKDRTSRSIEAYLRHHDK